LYGGFRFSNRPAQFWFRDADESEVYRPDVWDRREWARIDSICLISATRSAGRVRVDRNSDLAYWGDLKNGGRSGRWGSIDKRLPIEILRRITITLVLPKELSESAFTDAATAIDTNVRTQEGEPRQDSEIIAELKALYPMLDNG
jgi:hypothetical protein